MKWKCLLISLLVLILAGCVNNKKIQLDNINQVKISENLFDKKINETPENFIKNPIPDSQLLLDSIIKFTLKYPEKLIYSDIKDFSISEGKLVFLKNSYIVVPKYKCSKILTERNYNYIQFEYPYVLAYNNEFFEIFDINLCGSIFKKYEQFDL